MVGNYTLHFGGQAVGKVQVIQEGLYYRFICRCRLTGDVVCRAAVCCGDVRESLGVLVPVGDGFGLDTRIPVKHFGGEAPEFAVIPNRPSARERFVPIYPEEPFAYIERLKDAFLVVRNGQTGVIFQEECQLGESG